MEMGTVQICKYNIGKQLLKENPPGKTKSEQTLILDQEYRQLFLLVPNLLTKKLIFKIKQSNSRKILVIFAEVNKKAFINASLLFRGHRLLLYFPIDY
jgi:hypothetical protein